MAITMSAAWTTSSVSGLGGDLVEFDARLGERLDHLWVDGTGRVSAGRGDDHVVPGPMGEASRRHLRAAGVVAAHEQHPRPHAGRVLDLRQCVQALGGEPLSLHHEVGADMRVGGELLVGVGDQPLYRLRGVPALMPHGEARDTGRWTSVGKDRVRGRGHGENPPGSKRAARAGISPK